MEFHHIGFAVRSLPETRAAFEALGAKFIHASSDETRNLNFQFLKFNNGGGETLIELISPLDPALPCAVTNMVEKQPCMPYHVCLEVRNLEGEIARLKSVGFRQIDKVITVDVYGYEASGVFLFGRGIGVVELVQRC